MKGRDNKILGIAAAILCFLQLSDAVEVWQAGHPLLTAIVALAALVGTAYAVSNLLRPAAPLPPTPSSHQGLQAFLTGPNGSWNPKINAAFLCYFLSAILVSLAEPWGLSSISGIVGVLGLAGTVYYAFRAYKLGA